MTRLRARPSSAHSLLSRVLDEPELLGAVQSLEPRVLAKLVQHVGLEDAGELIALTTTEQLVHMFDEDVWSNERAGDDEAFDSRRFALWLAVLLEAGEDFAADRLAELSEDFLALGLHGSVLVVDLDALALQMSGSDDEDDNDALEKALDSGLYEEIGAYRVYARRHEGWDAVLSALLALDKNHHALLERLLSRCCEASSSFIEDNGGLYEVLTSAQMLESDAYAERDDRRAREGYVSPSAAKSFLELARITSAEEIATLGTRDPVAHAYFRELRASSPTPAPTRKRAGAGAARLRTLLMQAGVLERAAPQKRLAAARASAFERAMQSLAQTDAERHAQRIDELAFLANVVAAASSTRIDAMRPIDAVERVARLCDRGLAYLAERNGAGASSLVRDHGADKLFRLGWHLSHGSSRATQKGQPR